MNTELEFLAQKIAERISGGSAELRVTVEWKPILEELEWGVQHGFIWNRSERLVSALLALAMLNQGLNIEAFLPPDTSGQCKCHVCPAWVELLGAAQEVVLHASKARLGQQPGSSAILQGSTIQELEEFFRREGSRWFENDFASTGAGPEAIRVLEALPIVMAKLLAEVKAYREMIGGTRQ